MVVIPKQLKYAIWSNVPRVGMDFDGDEANVIVPYTQLGLREARELMFVTYHMASLAASNLLVGYHQDTNLAAHIMTLQGTYVDEQIWDLTAQVVYQERWTSKYPTYDQWKASFAARCIQQKVEPVSGKSLWSTLLPEDMNWSTRKAEIKNGILVKGTLDKSILSGSPASIGMVMYRTYGAQECVSWLNASYRSLNEYIIRMGVTLGISHLQISDKDKKIIDKEIQRSVSDPKLLEDTTLIKDPVLRERKEVEITQELNNVRERVAKIIMEGLQNTQNIPVEKDDRIILYQIQNKYTFDYDTREYEGEIEGIPIQGQKRIYVDQDGEVILDMYNGLIKVNKEEYPMSVFPVVNIGGKNYVYESPNSLLMMIKSGARGNETNGIQISGIIGQQNYANGRIPRMMSQNRSMPCFAPNDNSPASRGFIVPSYLRGMSPADYVSAHVASRENLTSNTDLTPKTGYFARRLRVFLEDLRIVRPAGRQIVINEKGVIVMFDFNLNPSYIFEIKGQKTFVDVKYEIDQIQQKQQNEAVYLYVPLLNNMRRYLALDRRIEQTIKLYPGKDIIIALDPNIEDQYPDFYQYLQDTYKDQIIITVPDTLSENQKRHWYLSFDNYSRVTYVPLDRQHNTAINAAGRGNYISINKSDINGISYPQVTGRIGNATLYQMLISGTNFEKFPMSLQPSEKLFNLLNSKTLLESLIIAGPIFAM